MRQESCVDSILRVEYKVCGYRKCAVESGQCGRKCMCAGVGGGRRIEEADCYTINKLTNGLS